MNVDKLLYRLDEEDIQELIGREVLATLNLLGGEHVYFRNLLKIVSNTFSKDELLTNKPIRDMLIDVMYKEEVVELAGYLNIPITSNIYNDLKNINFKASLLKRLFSFFEQELPSNEKIEFKDQEVVNVKYPLYPYQRNVLRKVGDYLSTERNRVLLHMPTGSGKTRTAISYICNYFLSQEGKNVVWFANTVELLDQAADEFSKAWSFLGNRDIKVHKFWGKSSIDLSEVVDGFIVCGLDKTHQMLMKDIATMSNFAFRSGLVIMDEAHMAIAPSYELLLENMIMSGASLIGLSATPGRTWNDPEEDRKLANFFFRQKAILEIPSHENPIDYLIEEGYLAKTKNTTLLHNTGIDFTDADYKYLAEYYVLPQHLLEKISKNRARNMLIISKIKELITKHQRVILFAITKDHAILMNSLLVALGINSMVVTSDTSEYNRAKIIEQFKTSREVNPGSIVLCNYGILTTGFDAPETSCAIIARPTDSLVLYSQMVGRAIRGIKSGGNREAEIVTVIDEKLPGFKEVADAFMNWEDVWK